jgi:hypothetical protein
MSAVLTVADINPVGFDLDFPVAVCIATILGKMPTD